MRRRTVLTAVAAVGASAAAGCLDAGPPASGSDDDGPVPGDDSTAPGTTDDGTADVSTTTDRAQSNGTQTDATQTGDTQTGDTQTVDTATDSTPERTTTEGSTPDDPRTTDDSAGETTAGETTTGETTDGTTAGGSGVELVDSSFEVRSVRCGSTAPRATVEFPSENTVRVTGAARGRNGCFSATLQDVSVDSADRSMVVDVTAYEPDSAEMCTQCLVDVSYVATFTFDGGRPKRVVVEHDGRRVSDGPEAH